jgi:hypothetical protein
MFLIVVSTFLFASCNYVEIHTRQYIGFPAYTATDPGTIPILHAAPGEPHDRIGEIAALPVGDPSVQQIESDMRAAAARMGANALVIVDDQPTYIGSTVYYSWYNSSVYADYQRVITAVAIHYLPLSQAPPATAPVHSP